MSHFDDVDTIAWAAPAGWVGLIILLVCLGWALYSDNAAAKVCREHGETYVDSRSGYVLCEGADHSVVKR